MKGRRLQHIAARTARTALILAALGVSGCATTTTAPKSPSASDIAATPQEKDARAFVEELTRHEWTAATQRFNQEMTESLSPSRLETVWTRTERTAGPWERFEQSRLETKDHVRTAVLIGRFAHRRRTLRVSFDAEQRISGFWIRPVAEDLEANARGLIEALVRRDMAVATKDFDARMRAAVPPQKLEETWKALLADIGDFVEIENLRVLEEPNVSVALATCRFARGRFVVKVAYRQDEVAAFFLLPADAS